MQFGVRENPGLQDKLDYDYDNDNDNGAKSNPRFSAPAFLPDKAPRTWWW